MSLSQCLLVIVAAAVLVGYYGGAHHTAEGQVIATAYANTNASRLVIAPGQPYVTFTVFTGLNATIFRAFATYPFNCNDTGCNSSSPIYVPREIVIPMPYCAITEMTPVAIAPSSCAGGLLLYGYRSFGPVPNETDYINGASDVNIQGLSITNVDTSSQQWKGTVTWLRPSGCPDDAAFQLDLSVGVLADVADYTPVQILDSASNMTLHSLIYGFACGNAPRPFNSPVLNPQPFFAPICRGFAPYIVPPINTTIYSQMFGTRIGPIDVPSGSVVYQLRFDNLGPSLRVHTHIRFVYPDNTQEDAVIYPGFNNIYYVRSNGTLPALAYVCYYRENCTLVLAWNEVQLGYLAPCNCQAPLQNILCNGTYDMENGPLNRTQIPNFNTAEPFVPNPTCVFAVNAAANGTYPIRNQPFQIQSLATGGAGPISYAWQLFGMPPSGGAIAMPTNTQTVTAIVYAPTLITIIHTVSTPSGIPQTCNQTIQIISGQPTACVTPVTFATMPVGSSIGIDASCSVSPDGGNLTYVWTLAASPFPYAGGTITGGGVAVGFSCTNIGWYILVVVVVNNIGTSSATSAILCVPIPVVPAPSGGPVTPPGTPISCGGTPMPPFGVPIPPPTGLPPIPVIPFPPSAPTSPEFAPTNPATEPPWGLGPAGELSQASLSLILGVVIILVLLCGCIGLLSLCMDSEWCCGRSPNAKNGRKVQ